MRFASYCNMMKTLLLTLLILFASVSGLLFCVDFAFYLHGRYCRFHIGRWSSRETWARAIRSKARRWVRHTPTVKITDNNRYLLFDMLLGAYRSHTIQSWQKAALLLGLFESEDPEDRALARRMAEAQLTVEGDWKRAPRAVDIGMLSYAILRICPSDRCRRAMDTSYGLIKASVHKSGMISYTGGKENPEMYVDTLGLVCPFLSLYGAVYGCEVGETLAFFQLKTYTARGMYGDTLLPNHAFHVETGLPLGVYGWGRGCGWYLIGLADTYAHLQDEEHRTWTLGQIRASAEALAVYQRSDGGFGSILQRLDTYDSSATAVLAWFYKRAAVLLGEARYEKIGEAALACLIRHTRITGAIDGCQGDTKGIGVFSQTYDIMPFAQGMVMRAMTNTKCYMEEYK